MTKKSIEDLDDLIAPVNVKKSKSEPRKELTPTEALEAVSKGRSWIAIPRDGGGAVQVLEVKHCTPELFYEWVTTLLPYSKATKEEVASGEKRAHSPKDYVSVEVREKTLDAIITWQAAMRRGFAGKGADSV